MNMKVLINFFFHEFRHRKYLILKNYNIRFIIMSFKYQKNFMSKFIYYILIYLYTLFFIFVKLIQVISTVT
jgi:hypothetical protein